jgi:uncharacterized phage infection (PIP) family protein YhgE
MTKQARRLGGIVAALVGLAGVAFAIIAVYETWGTVKRLKVEVPNAFNQLDAVVQSVHQQGQATTTLLDTTRQHLAALRTPIQQLANRNQRLTNADILATLDETILSRMESVEHFSLSIQSSMRSMSNALLILDSLPFLGAVSPSRNPRPNQWRDLAASLSETADLLEEASRSVARLRSGQNVAPQQMDQLASVLKQIDDHLQVVQENVRQFSNAVEQTDQTLTTVKEAAPVWIQRIAITVTVFFTCFGFSQISVILHGWQLLK